MIPLMLALFISTLDQTIVVTALDGIGASLGNPGAASWIATAYLLTSAVTTLIFGKLGDMYGRKRVFQSAIAIFVAGSFLCATATSMLWLIIFRAFQGVGGGALSSLVMAIIGDLVPARERARYQATLGIIPAVALVAGPLLGGVIVDRLSWPWIFLINVPIGLVAFFVVALQLHLPRRTSPHRVDLAGGLLAILFTTAFLLVTVFGGARYPWGSWQVIGLALSGFVFLISYVYVESRVAEPITPLRLFSSSVFSISSALFFLSTAILFVGMLFVPLMLQNVFGLSALLAGACIVPLLLGLIGATMVTGSMIARTGRYKIFPVLGALLCGAALFALATVSPQSLIWPIIIALVVMGAGVGLFIQVSLLAGQNAVAHRDLGVATGALNFFKSLGGAAGAAVFGTILAGALPEPDISDPAARLAAFHSVFCWALPLTAFALVLALLMKERPLSEAVIEIAEGKVEVPEY